MAFVRILAQLSRGLSVEHTCALQPHIRTHIYADGVSNLEKLYQTAPKSTSFQRAFHILLEHPLSQASSTAQSSAAAARSSLGQSCISSARLPCVAQTQLHFRSSSSCCSIAPALVRRWQPGPSTAGSSLLRSSGGISALRAFSAQAQRSQQRRQLQKKSSEQGVYLVALVVGMIGLTYASVPLYRCTTCYHSGYVLPCAHYVHAHSRMTRFANCIVEPRGFSRPMQQCLMLQGEVMADRNGLT